MTKGPFLGCLPPHLPQAASHFLSVFIPSSSLKHLFCREAIEYNTEKHRLDDITDMESNHSQWLSSCVHTGKLFNFTRSQFLHLWNADHCANITVLSKCLMIIILWSHSHGCFASLKSFNPHYNPLRKCSLYFQTRNRGKRRKRTAPKSM